MELASSFSLAAFVQSWAAWAMSDIMGKPAWMWLAFALLVALVLAFDLGVLRRGPPRAIGIGESFGLSAFYIALGCAFGGWVWLQLGPGPGMDYFTGFAIEKALAMDNVFVIAMIFSYFAVPQAYQHRVLFWGVLGVLVLRAVMIGAGAALIENFSWILYVFAAFLILTGVKMALAKEQDYDIANNPILRFARARLRVTDDLRGERFFVRQPDPKTGATRLYMTPLFLALIMIELADVVFAVDSVPAIFAITTDPYIVYTSNIFAILGLRALYFALAAMAARFHYLKYALAAVLIFIGGKIFIADMLGIAKIPASVSLGVTFSLLAAGVFYSLWRTRGAAPQA